MITENQVRTLLEDKLEGTDLYIVDVAVDAANKIRVEIDHFEGVSIKRCVEVSRYLENALDREKEDFELQVSSPGLDKGFKVMQQYHKNIGKEVELKLKEGGKLKGILTEVKDNGVKLETKRKERIEGKKKKQLIVEEQSFAFEEIEDAKIVISFGKQGS